MWYILEWVLPIHTEIQQCYLSRNAILQVEQTVYEVGLYVNWDLGLM